MQTAAHNSAAVGLASQATLAIALNSLTLLFATQQCQIRSKLLHLMPERLQGGQPAAFSLKVGYRGIADFMLPSFLPSSQAAGARLGVSKSYSTRARIAASAKARRRPMLRSYSGTYPLRPQRATAASMARLGLGIEPDSRKEDPADAGDFATVAWISAPRLDS